MSAFDFLKIKKTVNDLQSHIVKLRSELSSLQDERAEIAKAPATREDVKNFFFSRIDKKGEDYARIFDDLARGLASRPERLGRTSDAAIMTATRFDMMPTALTIEGAACAFLDSVLKQGVSAAIDAAPWPANAMPIADRQRQLETLDARIAGITAQEGELIRHANESGLAIY
jgi:hypothetical protein